MYINELLKGAKNQLKWSGIAEREQEKRFEVVKEALTWLHTPYHHMGRVKGAGVDCGMLVAEIFERVGLLPHLDFSYYASDWAMHRSEEKYLGYTEQYFTRKPPEEEVLPGDILLHQFGRCISHGVIVIFQNTIIHAYVGRGVILGDRRQEDLKRREKGCYSAKY